ncbi:HNH endonuclease signature motif containing protein [uncultured Nocardioides sp.]|uniref:HNH endonuclease signature motif containing protein n=1 Tax=uncultured Nocardioides sp. TaxID=198441 RepID=UPI00263216C3|nr:HNH endonuclease signature motif containing protein [uncultured Nocardioides sp.]
MALGHQDHSAQDSAPVPTGDLLTEIRDLDKAADQADRDRFIAVAEWAERHTTGQLLPDLYGTFGLPDDDAHTEAENAWVSRFGMPGADTMLELAGPGAPEISEFAVVELAAALGRSTDSGRMLLSDAVEARYRLPKIWQRLLDGQVQVWRVRRVTDLTRSLTAEAAAFVDAHLAHVVHTASFTTVKRLVAEAAARFDPETTEMEEADTAATLHVTLDLTTAWSIGTANGVHLSGLLDRADAEELEHAIRTIADQLLAAGSQDSLDVRRAKALGYLSRGDLTLDLATELTTEDASSSVEEARQRRLETTKPTTRTRQVVLHIHLSEAALKSSPEVDPDTGKLGLHLARVENHHQTLTADTVREWLAVPGSQITVKPVIDLHDQIAVDAYEIPDRISTRIKLKRPTCVFPHCTRTSTRVDLDHIDEYVPPDRGGPPGQTATDRLAPLCRRHHRAKTHPSPVPSNEAGSTTIAWDYVQLTPTTWLWTSPHGIRYLVHPDGTTTL